MPVQPSKYESTDHYIDAEILDQAIRRSVTDGACYVRNKDDDFSLPVHLPPRIYAGILKTKDSGDALDSRDIHSYSTYLVNFEKFLTSNRRKLIDLKKELTIDFGMIDTKRGHFTRLSICFEPSTQENKRLKVTLINQDTLFPKEKKNTEQINLLQKDIRNTLLNAFNSHGLDVSPSEHGDQYQQASAIPFSHEKRKQVGSTCADEVMSDFLKLYGRAEELDRYPSFKEDVLEHDSEDKRTALASERRKQFLQLIVDKCDPGIVNIAMAGLTEKYKPAGNQVSSLAEHVERKSKLDKAPLPEKKSLLINECQNLCRSLNGAWGTNSLSLHGDDAVSVHGDKAEIKFDYKADPTGKAELITLTRQYDQDTGITHRSFSSRLSWEKQCELFAKMSHDEAKNKKSTLITKIDVPKEIEMPANFKGITFQGKKVSQDVIPLAQQLCIASYLKHFDTVSFEVDGKTYVFTQKENQNVLAPSKPNMNNFFSQQNSGTDQPNSSGLSSLMQQFSNNHK